MNRVFQYSAVAVILCTSLAAQALDLNKVSCTRSGSLVISFAEKEMDFDYIGTVGGGNPVDVIVGAERVPATYISLSTPSWPPVSQVDITLSKSVAGVSAISIGQNGSVLTGKIKTGEGANEALNCQTK